MVEATHMRSSDSARAGTGEQAGFLGLGGRLRSLHRFSAFQVAGLPTCIAGIFRQVAGSSRCGSCFSSYSSTAPASCALNLTTALRTLTCGAGRVDAVRCRAPDPGRYRSRALAAAVNRSPHRSAARAGDATTWAVPGGEDGGQVCGPERLRLVLRPWSPDRRSPGPVSSSR